jgi:hypothetical protein
MNWLIIYKWLWSPFLAEFICEARCEDKLRAIVLARNNFRKQVRQLLGFFYIGTGLYKFRNIFKYTERIKQKSTLEKLEINAQARRYRKYPKFFWTECVHCTSTEGGWSRGGSATVVHMGYSLLCAKHSLEAYRYFIKPPSLCRGRKSGTITEIILPEKSLVYLPPPSRAHTPSPSPPRAPTPPPPLVCTCWTNR